MGAPGEHVRRSVRCVASWPSGPKMGIVDHSESLATVMVS
jgi:hypothetical protein